VALSIFTPEILMQSTATTAALSSRNRYDQEENAVWSDLCHMQLDLLQGHVPEEFAEGRRRLAFDDNQVPLLPDLNRNLAQHTDFALREVETVSPPREFFGYLSRREFPVRTHLRPRSEFYSVDWPDIFHEVFGHGPFLGNEDYALFLERFGAIAGTLDKEYFWQMFRLFWFTAEFGLIEGPEGHRILGAGILSSVQETRHVIARKPEFRPFDLLNVLRTPYKVQFPQPLFYVLPSFQALGKLIDSDFKGYLEEARALGDLTPAPVEG
jgi:phenylalanine-4-hydroxylase